MSNVGGALQAVVAILAIAGVLGLALTVVFDRRNTTRLNDLRDDIKDRNERIDFLETENKRLDDLNKSQADEIREMHGELKSLREFRDAQAGPLLTMTRLIESIIEMMRNLHDLVQSHHDTAKAGFAVLETQHADELRILGNRRNVPEESVTREVGDV